MKHVNIISNDEILDMDFLTILFHRWFLVAQQSCKKILIIRKLNPWLDFLDFIISSKWTAIVINDVLNGFPFLKGNILLCLFFRKLGDVSLRLLCQMWADLTHRGLTVLNVLECHSIEMFISRE